MKQVKFDDVTRVMTPSPYFETFEPNIRYHYRLPAAIKNQLAALKRIILVEEAKEAAQATSGASAGGADTLPTKMDLDGVEDSS